jgi:hypothetical protein
MEFLIVPVIGLAGMYIINKQNQNKENFEDLPNVNVPDKNYPNEKIYPNEYPVSNQETDITSKLSTQNKFDEPEVYTDKYFNQSLTDNKSTDLHPSHADYTSITGEPVGFEYFRHNNMLPFFGSKVHTNNDSNATESTLDNYNGSGSQYISKKEQSYPHCGKMPISQDKYIITGWFYTKDE